MLNELCQLADSLEKAGIVPKEWHGQLKLLPKVSEKKPCYRIFISDKGRIAAVDVIPAELAPKLRKWEPSNGNSFPGFNIQPLYRVVKEEQKKKLKEWREGKEKIDTEKLRSWLLEDTNNWDRKLISKLEKCLKEIPQALVAMKNAKGTNTVNDSLAKLLSRVVLFFQKDSGSEKGSAFRLALEEHLWEGLKKSESIKTYLGMLIYEGIAEKDPENDRGAISVFFDIPDWIEYPAASSACVDALNALLVSDSQQKTDSSGLDAFGSSALGSDDKLPGVKLPFVAEVKLRAMNSESTCQFRYRTIDAESFPIGQESRKRAKGALEWLGDQSREGETWGRADSKELIFAYPAVLPKVSLKLAACFGAQKAENSEARFANAAKDVIVGLTGITQDFRNLELRVFSLKKMDKARTKVVFHRNYSAQRLVDATKEWQDGAENIPIINIRAWGVKKGDIISLQTEIPFPLEIAPCLNRIWKLNGTTECEAPIIARSQGIELLLDEKPERFIPHLLSVVLQNGKGLLLSMGNDLNQGNVISIKGYDKHKLLIPSILGLLLHKLGIRKESFMSNAPFLVGRMLKIADELHALYCKEVRKNSLPPQLLGNSLMTAALDSPNQALSLLSRRFLPYQAWARTNSSVSAGLSRYFLKQFEEVELAGAEIPERLKDAERAQLLLGYLSANPKKADKITETIPTDKN
jgi:hypothetical protein